MLVQIVDGLVLLGKLLPIALRRLIVVVVKSHRLLVCPTVQKWSSFVPVHGPGESIAACDGIGDARPSTRTCAGT